MIRFDILTLFPDLFDGVFEHSIVKRAREAGLLSVRIHNIRSFCTDKHQVTDDTPYGGGGGMVMKVEPITAALEHLVNPGLIARQKATDVVTTPIVLLSPTGRRFSQQIAQSYQRYERVILICGRYEGVDERVVDLAVTDQLSIGDYVLSGGEIPAMVIVETIARLVPGVLGDMRALIDDTHANGLLEYPHYTRPSTFRSFEVPEILLSGDHARIAKWRREQSLSRTLKRRPDLLEGARLTESDRRFLESIAKEDQAPEG